MGEVVAPFPDDVEDVHDFRFYQGTDDDRFRYAGIRFLRRAQAARQESDAQVGDDGLDHEVPLARFEDDLRLETDFLTVLDDFVVQVEVVAVEDQRFVGQFSSRESSFPWTGCCPGGWMTFIGSWVREETIQSPFPSAACRRCPSR